MSEIEVLAGMPGWAEDVDALAQSGSYADILSAATTPPNLGVFGSSVGHWWVTGNMLMTLFCDIQWGQGGTQGSGDYRLLLPAGWHVAAPLITSIGPVGPVRMRRVSPISEEIWFAATHTNPTFLTIRSSSNFNAVAAGPGTPWAWANEFRIRTGPLTFPVVPDD